MFIIATKPDLHPFQLHKHHVWGENSLISVIRALVARDLTKITESCNVSGGGQLPSRRQEDGYLLSLGPEKSHVR